MVKTRGRCSQPEGRTRPTTSVRRGDRGASSSAPVGGANASEVVGFPGGASDVSLLVSYHHHVALRLWQGEVRLCYNFLLCLCCV